MTNDVHVFLCSLSLNKKPNDNNGDERGMVEWKASANQKQRKSEK